MFDNYDKPRSTDPNRAKGQVVILAQKIIRREMKPTPETCAQLIMQSGIIGDNPSNSSDKEIKTLIDQAIGTCRNDMYAASDRKAKEDKDKRKKGESSHGSSYTDFFADF